MVDTAVLVLGQGCPRGFSKKEALRVLHTRCGGMDWQSLHNCTSTLSITVLVSALHRREVGNVSGHPDGCLFPSPVSLAGMLMSV